jgi:hypothetical protein
MNGQYCRNQIDTDNGACDFNELNDEDDKEELWAVYCIMKGWK